MISECPQQYPGLHDQTFDYLGSSIGERLSFVVYSMKGPVSVILSVTCSLPLVSVAIAGTILKMDPGSAFD